MSTSRSFFAAPDDDRDREVPHAAHFPALRGVLRPSRSRTLTLKRASRISGVTSGISNRVVMTGRSAAIEKALVNAGVLFLEDGDVRPGGRGVRLTS